MNRDNFFVGLVVGALLLWGICFIFFNTSTRIALGTIKGTIAGSGPVYAALACFDGKLYIRNYGAVLTELGAPMECEPGGD